MILYTYYYTVNKDDCTQSYKNYINFKNVPNVMYKHTNKNAKLCWRT